MHDRQIRVGLSDWSYVNFLQVVTWRFIDFVIVVSLKEVLREQECPWAIFPSYKIQSVAG